MRHFIFCTLLLAALPSPARTAEESVPADKALLVVRLPASASLTIDDAYTVQRTGAERTLVTPTLPAGATYRYTLKATWDDNGTLRGATREAAVRAGKRVVVDFTKAEPLAMPGPPTQKPDAPRSRTFLFTYAASVTDLKPGTKARIWLPVPPSNAEQEVTIESKELPAAGKMGKDSEYGNPILYAEGVAGKDGTIPLQISYRVTRREVRGEDKPTEDQKQIARFLQADSLVPIGGKSLDLIKNKKVPVNQYAAARVFYDAVNGHMRYSKEGAGWGRGDSEWACDSKFGNCTDFHSLFISLARARKIPAKFEIGFPLPPKRGSGDVPGYHCWAWFKPQGKGWVPVDISEANKAKDDKATEYYFGNLTEDRVVFTTGRDIELVPKQAGKPLNFFVYPYVEVDGKPYDKVQRKFGYEDVK